MKTKAAFLIAILFLLAPVMFSGEIILIRNGTIVPVIGPVLEQGDLLIEDGRIKRIAEEIPVPPGAHVIDASGKFVYPGIIAPMTSVGVTGYPGAGDDLNEKGAFTPHIDAYDAINPEDVTIDVTRIEGITTVVTASGTRDIFNGKAVILNLSGNLVTDMVLKRDVFQIIKMGPEQGSFGPSGSSSAGPRTHAGIFAFIRNKLSQVKSSIARGDSESNQEFHALVPVVSGKMPVLFLTNNRVTLRNAIRLIDEFDLRGIIYAQRDIYPFIDSLHDKDIPVIWDGTKTTPRPGEPFDVNYTGAMMLAEKAVKFAIDVGSWGPWRDMGSRPTSHHTRTLPQTAALSVAHGLSETDALKAMTIDTARILGIDDRVGSLEPGKMANVVIWTGSPLQLRSRVETVIINGQIVPLTSYQTRLRDKFNKIVRDRMKKK